MEDLQQAQAVALQAAREAAQVHQKYRGTVRSDDWAQKGVADFVSHVDHEAEARVLETIAQHFPDHDVLAEESAAEGAQAARTSDYQWVVDPLDGTTNFLHGYPMYCSSVALMHQGVPVVAALVCGPSKEEWTATRGGGAFLNGKPIRVSETRRLEHALIGTGFPFKLPDVIDEYLAQFRAVSTRVSDIRRAGAAALDLCHVATGYFDGFWELDLRPWDYAAGALVVREAGGIVTGVDMKEPNYETAGGIIAGNPFVYPLLAEIVKGA